MGDVGLTFPPWLVAVYLSLQFWPVVAILAAGAVLAAILRRGVLRLLAAALAALLIADLALVAGLEFHQWRDAAAQGNFEQGRHATLTAAQTVDGLTLPAGTLVTWSDPAHTHVETATLPGPTPLLGVDLIWLERDPPDAWLVHLDAAATIDGWTCQPDLVGLDADGHLRSCTLAAARQWNGWPVAAASLLSLGRPDHTLGFVFPDNEPIMSPEIGRNLPNSGMMTINQDGSLDSIYLEMDQPLTVCGVKLWNTLKWEYGRDSFGRGRARPALLLHGALADALVRDEHEIKPGTSVALRLADCALSPE